MTPLLYPGTIGKRRAGLIRPPSAVSLLDQLIAAGPATFIKDYSAVVPGGSNDDADYALGSPTASITVSRSASNPATYNDADGKVTVVTDSNTPRISQGFWTPTGFVDAPGLLVEEASQNYLLTSDGTLNAAGLWTGWSQSNSTLAGSPTVSNPSASDITTIPGATWQRVRYTALTGDSGDNVRIRATQSTPEGSFVQNDVVILSFWALSPTGMSGCDFKVTIEERSAGDGSTVATQSSAAIPLTSAPKRFFVAFTISNASTQRIRVRFGCENDVADGDLVDFQFALPQPEKNRTNGRPSSYIPTSGTSLVRNAETPSFAIAGNRTANTEVIAYKVCLPWNESDETVDRYAGDTDTKSRRSLFASASSAWGFFPNSTDSPTSASGIDEGWAAFESHFLGCVAFGATAGTNSGVLGDSTIGTNGTNYASPSWGTNFYVGCKGDGTSQINGIIQMIAIYDGTGATQQMVEDIRALFFSVNNAHQQEAIHGKIAFTGDSLTAYLPEPYVQWSQYLQTFHPTEFPIIRVSPLTAYNQAIGGASAFKTDGDANWRSFGVSNVNEITNANSLVSDGMRTSFVWIGHNDFNNSSGDVYGKIYNGEWSQATIDAYVANVVAAIFDGVDDLYAGGVENVIVGTCGSYNITPTFQATYTDATKRARFNAVIAQLNAGIIGAAQSRGMVIMRYDLLFNDLFGTDGTLIPTQVVGGNTINMRGASADPSDAFTEDGIHPGTAVMSIFAAAGLYVLHEHYGLDIGVPTEALLCERAGLPITDGANTLSLDFGEYIMAA